MASPIGAGRVALCRRLRPQPHTPSRFLPESGGTPGGKRARATAPVEGVWHPGDGRLARILLVKSLMKRQVSPVRLEFENGSRHAFKEVPMLVLTRKAGEKIVINDNVVIE